MSVQDLPVQLYTVPEGAGRGLRRHTQWIASIGYTRVEPFQFIDFRGELKEGMSKYVSALDLAREGLTYPSWRAERSLTPAGFFI
jgi:hypothetical protein